MITAVDSNVLFDLLIPDAPQMEESRGRLERAAETGTIVISEAALAEVASRFDRQQLLEQFLLDSDIALKQSGELTLFRAARAWRDYARRRGGSFACSSCGTRQTVRCRRCATELQSRQHVLADFLIGAHALVQADRQLTRDVGYYKTYFPGLRLA